MTKEHASESERTRKLREKLQKQLDEIEKKITPNALKKKTEEIHEWISTHARHRVVLKDKNISLFDENQNSAAFSSNIASIVQSIAKKHLRFPLQVNEEQAGEALDGK